MKMMIMLEVKEDVRMKSVLCQLGLIPDERKRACVCEGISYLRIIVLIFPKTSDNPPTSSTSIRWKIMSLT